MSNPHDCGVPYVVHILTALQVRLAQPEPPVQPVRQGQREQPAQPEPLVQQARQGQRARLAQPEPLVQPVRQGQREQPVQPEPPVQQARQGQQVRLARPRRIHLQNNVPYVNPHLPCGSLPHFLLRYSVALRDSFLICVGYLPC